MKLIITEKQLKSIRHSLLENNNQVGSDQYSIGSEKGSTPTTFHVVDENMEDEVESSEVDLSSFKKEKELPTKIWKGNYIDSRVRLKLLDIADDFWDYVGLDWVKRKGVCLTGSICNYNWSKFSDIDLHIIVDFSEVSDKTDFVKDYFDSKKNEWNNEHDSLKIHGFPVELYVEDINAETESGGIYDLEQNKWVKKPNKDEIHSIESDKQMIKEKSSQLMTKIDNYCLESNSTDDSVKLSKIGKKCKKLLSKLKAMRKFGLNRGGETDPYNIIYKVLRRTEYLDKLWNLSSTLYDKINSIQ